MLQGGKRNNLRNIWNGKILKTPACTAHQGLPFGTTSGAVALGAGHVGARQLVWHQAPLPQSPCTHPTSFHLAIWMCTAVETGAFGAQPVVQQACSWLATGGDGMAMPHYCTRLKPGLCNTTIDVGCLSPPQIIVMHLHE